MFPLVSRKKNERIVVDSFMLSFKPVDELDRNQYRAHLKKCAFTTSSCEYAYANLFAWSDLYHTEWAWDEAALYLRMHFENETHYLCPITPKERLKGSCESLAATERAKGKTHIRFSCLPEDYEKLLSAFWGDGLVTHDRGHADYLYETPRLVTFPGKSLHAKKNHLNRFFALYGDSFSFHSMTGSTEEIACCLAFNKEWYALNSGEGDEELSEERKAVEKMLNHFSSLALCGGMLYVGERLCGYTLASDNYDGAETLCVHVEKGLYDITGVYPALCSEFLKHCGSAYALINREDDLNDEGLRRSKESYQPVRLEEKYACVYAL